MPGDLQKAQNKIWCRMVFQGLLLYSVRFFTNHYSRGRVFFACIFCARIFNEVDEVDEVDKVDKVDKVDVGLSR